MCNDIKMIKFEKQWGNSKLAFVEHMVALFDITKISEEEVAKLIENDLHSDCVAIMSEDTYTNVFGSILHKKETNNE